VETVTSEIAEGAAETLDLWIPKPNKAAIKRDQVYAIARPIYGRGSEWFWGKYKKGEEVNVKVGGATMFVSKVESAKTVKIGKMVRKDFEGIWSPASMRGKTLQQLRQKLVAELSQRNERSNRGLSGVITLESEVRVVRVMPYNEARSKIEANRGETAYEPIARKPVSLPESLSQLHRYLPKAVYLDMRLFGDSVPYEILEDMTKLMKAGVYFVLLSDKPADEVNAQMMRGLTPKQRDQVSRYKMIVLSDDGNRLAGFDGNFASALPSVRFTPQQLEMMRFAGSLIGAKADAESWGGEFVYRLPKGQNAAAYRDAFLDTAAKLGMPAASWSVELGVRGRDQALIVRPQSLISALPHLAEVLREHEGLYVNNSDLMVISRDERLLSAMKGSVQPASVLDAQGADLADASLAAILGPYRENMKGDLAASASKISSFIHNPDGGGGGNFGNVYMMMGHVMHSAFNWAVWKYRNEGVLPSADETLAVAKAGWAREDGDRTKNMLDKPGESMAGFYEVMEARLRTMHAVAADLLKVYPIAVGTEIPNLFVIDRHKKGVGFEHRDIFRLIFDFVVARQTPEGLEVVVVDFKTGQTPTLQNLEKDTQVQLYDMVVRELWESLTLPFGGTGKSKRASDWKIRFIYPAGAYQPILNEWTRIKFEKFLRNVMNRIRRHNSPPPPKEEAKKGGKKKS
jgi:uncharacterized protein YodC (DUF2158 family)